MAKYLIQRKSADNMDVFSVLLRQACSNGGRCKSCAGLSAADPASSVANFSLSCACSYHYRTFLPEKGKCLTDKEVVNALKGAFAGRSLNS